MQISHKRTTLQQIQQHQQQKQQQITLKKIDKSSEPLSFVRSSNAFYTSINQLSQEGQLSGYIQNLQKKVQNALWKQQVLLLYNYMPLQAIKQKIQQDRSNYQQKIQNFRQEYRKGFQNQQFTQQLDDLRQFNTKLKQKMKTFSLKIEQQKVKNSILKKQSDQKRESLKQLIKSNMQLSKSIAQQMGASNKRQLVRIIRSKSLNNIKKPSYPTYQPLFQPSKTTRSISTHNGPTKNLVQQCLNLLLSQLRLMNSSSDIQQGIYLQIMNRPILTGSLNKVSSRSTISNTLQERYKKKVHQMRNKHFEEQDFYIDLQTFTNLNYKQMLGVIMVKDRNCQLITNLFNRFAINM